MLFVFRQGIRFADFGNEHERVRAVHLSGDGAKSFAQQPLDTVALYAFPVSFPYGNPHAHFIGRAINNRERGGKAPAALFEKPLEIRLFFQSVILHGAPPFSRSAHAVFGIFTLFAPVAKNGKSSPLRKRKGIFAYCYFSFSVPRIYDRRLVRQSLSALVATSFQHLSTCRRCHSLTEAVHLALLSFFGLIRSLHTISPDFGFLSVRFICSRFTPR